MYLMELGALKAHSLYSSSQRANWYQAPPSGVAYALQKPFKEELEWLQKMDTITPVGIDELTEWCNSFVFIPKANGKV